MTGFTRFRVAEVKKLVVKEVLYETSDFHDAVVEFRSAEKNDEMADVEVLGTTDGKNWNILQHIDPQHALGGFD